MNMPRHIPTIYDNWTDEQLKTELKNLEEEGLLETNWEKQFVQDCAYSPGRFTLSIRLKSIEILADRG